MRRNWILALLSLAICTAEAGSLSIDSPGARFQQDTLPAGFGEGEFTLELWVRPDPSYDWVSDDPVPNTGCCWWYQGNFLLDGHNNSDFTQGTFSLQLYGSGRVRWLLGDGTTLIGVQAYPATQAPSITDGQWHHIAVVRRWQDSNGALLELWVNGNVVNIRNGSRADLTQYWFDDYPRPGFTWGYEKQGVGPDYRGEIDEIRFHSRALSPDEIQQRPERIAFEEGSGSLACGQAGCGTLIGANWSDEEYTGTTAEPPDPEPPPPPPPSGDLEILGSAQPNGNATLQVPAGATAALIFVGGWDYGDLFPAQITLGGQAAVTLWCSTNGSGCDESTGNESHTAALFVTFTGGELAGIPQAAEGLSVTVVWLSGGSVGGVCSGSTACDPGSGLRVGYGYRYSAAPEGASGTVLSQGTYGGAGYIVSHTQGDWSFSGGAYSRAIVVSLE